MDDVIKSAAWVACQRCVQETGSGDLIFHRQRKRQTSGISSHFIPHQQHTRQRCAQHKLLEIVFGGGGAP